MIEYRKWFDFLIGERFVDEKHTYTKLDQCAKITKIGLVYKHNSKKNGEISQMSQHNSSLKCIYFVCIFHTMHID
jgi:hypothetical protein